jgi:primosomal protein N' (replication factor Y)
MAIIRVALDVPLDCLFDYVSGEINETATGLRVRVPFRKREVIGIILEISTSSQIAADKLKPVHQLYQETPPLPPDLIDLFQFCNRYYHYPIGQVVMNSLPVLLRKSKPVSCKPYGTPIWKLTPAGQLIEINTIPARSKVKRELLGLLQQNQEITAALLGDVTSHTRKLLRELVASGWVEQTVVSHEQQLTVTAAPLATAEQAEAIAAITATTQQFTPWLLHSSINNNERLQGWCQAQQQQTGIVLGTRLAIFTPFANLGLIVIDEEQDHSFKQQDGLRYSARDLAIYRARQLGIPVILGSATPSLESYHHAINGHYRHLRLRTRAASRARLPAIHCIDLRIVKAQEGLTDPVLDALRDTTAQNLQSLVFINRRGYAPVLLCKSCRWIATCSRCSSRLVFHLSARQLRCHYCGYQQSVPSACPQCGDQDILPFGHGTQRIESTLISHLPDARIIRVDRDSTRHKHAWQTMLTTIQHKKVDILIGTQLLAKGHDFPDLALVCIINPDASLYSPDFRAEEQLFTQLMQVAGRAGRAEAPGTVLIQTAFPHHPIYQALIRQDYDHYAQQILKDRQAMDFPPFVYQAVLRAEAPAIQDALTFLGKAAAISQSKHTRQIQLFDPVPASMMRLNGMERAQLLVQASSRKSLQLFLSDWQPHLVNLPTGNKLRWHLDIDPLSL